MARTPAPAPPRVFPGKYLPELKATAPRIFPRKYLAEVNAAPALYPVSTPPTATAVRPPIATPYPPIITARPPITPPLSPIATPHSAIVTARPLITPVRPLTGPQTLRLWTGREIEVHPATLHWEAARAVSRWSVPDTAAGWHSNSADCGAGVTVIGGHMAYKGLPGVFAPLTSIGPGEDVHCTDQHGHVRRFRPVDYLVSSQNSAPTAWHPEWTPALLLYTCTPELDGHLIVVRFEEVEG